MPVHLSPRERQVVRLFSLGCNLAEVAAILEIALNTVNRHKTSAMTKLGTNKTALLTRIAIRERITSVRDRLTAAEKQRSGRGHDGWN